MKPAAALAHPKFGLAYSNRNAKEDVLLRNALLQGRFDAILESAAVDGIDFVKTNLENLKQRGSLKSKQVTKLERMIKSIEKGFQQAMDEFANSKRESE